MDVDPCGCLRRAKRTTAGGLGCEPVRPTARDWRGPDAPANAASSPTVCPGSFSGSKRPSSGSCREEERPDVLRDAELLDGKWSGASAAGLLEREVRHGGQGLLRPL